MTAQIRPPAVPLVTIDPYTSCWSFADRLYDEWPRHWTGTEFALCGMVRVDGKPLRFMGGKEVLAESVRQISVEVQPTRTIYRFEAGAVELEVVFISPLLLDDLELLSRPASYVWFRTRSLDGAPHDVRIYLDMDEELRRYFKIRRDVGERGHSLESVERSIARRQPDAIRFINPQSAQADIVFSLQPVNANTASASMAPVNSLE